MIVNTNRSVTGGRTIQHTLCMDGGTGKKPVRGSNAKKTPEGELAGERLKRAMIIVRDDAGQPYNQTTLAEKTGVPYSRLGNYIQGTRKLPIREAKRIEAGTGIPAAYLMGLVGESDMELLRLPAHVRAALLQVAASVSR